MANWQALVGKRADLDKMPKQNGYVYWCYDDGSVFFDYLDSITEVVQRQQISAKNAETLTGKTLEELTDYIRIQSDWKQTNTSAADYIKNKPSKLSEFTEDTTHRLVTDAEKNAWNAKSTFSGSYNDLTNKPTIGTGTLTITQNGGNKKTFSANATGNTTVDIDIPTALADLTEDETHRLVTDAEKNVWSAKSNFSGNYNDLTNKPTIPTPGAGVLTIKQNGTKVVDFSADSSSAATANITVPTKLSDLSEDSSHKFVTQAEKEAWSAKSNFSGSYNDLTNKPTIGNAVLTIVKGKEDGSNLQFSANATTDVSFTLPTELSELAQDQNHLLVTQAEKETWNRAQANQNAFSNVKVGSTTIAADAATDTLELVAGSNVTLTPNATNDKVTIAASHPTISKSTDSTSTAAPEHGLTFTAVDDITRDSNGHVTKINIKTITLPDAGLHYVDSSDMTVTAGSSTSGAYLATKWSIANVDGITTPTDGMSISLRTPAAGYSGGILLSIDGGTTYHPIVRNVNTLVTTHYAQGSTLILTFNSTQTAAPYTTAGTTTTVTGCWQIADYDKDTTYTNVKLGHGYATCSTAAGTKAKTASLSSYTLTTGGIVAVKFTNGITVASPTLNINSKGAKAIYYKGAALTDTTLIKAGDTVTFIYSSNYHILSIDRLASDVNKLASDVNTHVTDATIHVTSAEKEAWNSKVGRPELNNYIPNSALGTSIPTLIPTTGKIDTQYLPSYVDDIEEWAALEAFPAQGESGKIYVDLGSGKIYRWGSTQYVEISASLALGTTSSTAFRGDLGQAAYEHANSPHYTSLSDGTNTASADTSNNDTIIFKGTQNITVSVSDTNNQDTVSFSVPNGTSSTKGVVKITDNIDSTAANTAATPKAVKGVQEYAEEGLSGKAKINHTHSVTHKPAGTNESVSLTPQGTVSKPTFTGTAAKHAHTFTGTAASHNHGFTGTGVVIKGTFTGTEQTASCSYTPAGTVTVTPSTSSITKPSLGYSNTKIEDIITSWSAGSGSLTGSVSNKTLVLTHSHTAPSLGKPANGTVVATKITSWSTGTFPSTVATGISSATFSGTGATISHKHTPAGTIAITAAAPVSGETANYTPAGTVGSKSLTPAGTIAEQSLTPAGSVSQPTFTGTAASHTHTFTGTEATLTTSTEQ